MNNKGRWCKDKFHLYWLDDAKHIMVIRYTKTYDWHDYYAMMEVAADMVEGIAHPIVYINDFFEDIEIPTDSAAPHYTNMRRMFATPTMVLILRTVQQIRQVQTHSGMVGFEQNENLFLATSFDEAVIIAERVSERLINQYAVIGDTDGS